MWLPKSTMLRHMRAKNYISYNQSIDRSMTKLKCHDYKSIIGVLLILSISIINYG